MIRTALNHSLFNFMWNMSLTRAFLFLLYFREQVAEQCCETVEDTELVMAFLVHRHGDRAPEKEELFLSDNPKELAKMSEPYGYGQLTSVGIARSYALGRFFRRRYNQLISSSYNSSEIFVQCTESNRTQMTAKIAFTAVYSSEELWSEDTEMVPLDLNVIPFRDDPKLYLANCPTFYLFFEDVLKSKPEEMRNYDKVLDKLSEGLGLNLTDVPLFLYLLADVFASQQSVGMPLSDLNRQLVPAIQQGAGIAANYIYGNETYLPLEAGVLLNEFFKIADQIISGAPIPKMRVFSVHDNNVSSFTAITRAVPKQGVPGYCSVYSLELRRCKYSGEYVVVPVYVKSPDEREAFLEIEECGVICDYNKFRELTSKNVLTELQYKLRCKANGDEPSLFPAEDWQKKR